MRVEDAHRFRENAGRGGRRNQFEDENTICICEVDGSHGLLTPRASTHVCHACFCNVQILIDLPATLKCFIYWGVTVSQRDEINIGTYSDLLATTASSDAAELGK